MTNSINRHGLDRHIPADVRRKIRKNSKYGCVICRAAIYTYEHILPTFKDAEEHDPDKMCILCPNHQTDSTNGVLPKKRILEAYNEIRQADDAVQPHRQGFFDLFDQSPIVRVGSVDFIDFKSIVNIDKTDILAFVTNLESEGPRFLISGIFMNSEGVELFRIVDNEWIGNTGPWDVDIVGTELTIRARPRTILFKATKNVAKNIIDISRLDMFANPFHVLAKPSKLSLGQYSPNGDTAIYFDIGRTVAQRGHCGIYLDSSKSRMPAFESLIIEAQGVYIKGTGICIGRGSSQIVVGPITVRNWRCSIRSPSCLVQPKSAPQYFVKGVLEERHIQYPLWQEVEYYLNGQRLENRPFSWGKIAEAEGKPVCVYHVAPNEPEDIEANPGFIGYYADELLVQEYADHLFEAVVADVLDDGRPSNIRTKRSEIQGRPVVEEINNKTGHYFHPHEFVGISPWKK